MSRPFTSNLILAAVLIAAMGALAWAKSQGLVQTNEWPTRGFMALIGLINAGYANVIPKSGKAVSGRLQGIRRVVGWSMTLGGLAFAAAWIFAPYKYAADLSMGAVAIGVSVAIGYCLLNNKPTQRAEPQV